MAEPVVNVFTVQLRAESLEDLQGIVAAPSAQLVNNAFNWDLYQYTPSTTVPVSRSSHQNWTIGGGGTVDIDLTALPSSQSNIDGTGKKLQVLVINNIAAASINADIAAGAKNIRITGTAGHVIEVAIGLG